MKTIDFELSKKLNDLGLLDNIDTEYVYHKIIKGIDEGKYVIIINHELEGKTKTDIKTLTIEEAIEFLPDSIRFPGGVPQGLTIHKYDDENKKYGVVYDFLGRKTHYFGGKTILEAIEKMIEYLLENGLLNKN